MLPVSNVYTINNEIKIKKLLRKWTVNKTTVHDSLWYIKLQGTELFLRN